MSTKEREGRYREAVRYFENATKILGDKAKKQDNRYQDVKYVRMACGTAYSGTLLALDAYLEIKGKPFRKNKGKRTSVEEYRKDLAQIDSKALNAFNDAYNILHLAGYYDGITNAEVIKIGLRSALEIMNKIRPAGLASINYN